MRILICSPAFYPSVGGLEAVVGMLAEGLTESGCSVRVVTTTPASSEEMSMPYEVVRSPSVAGMLSLMRWSDVVFHHNVSLKGLWPLFFIRRPWVVAHHGWYARSNGTTGWQDQLKLFATRFATNIAVSRAVADHLGVQCSVIHNPYRDDLFRGLADVPRDKELVFLGRLVSDKGCDLLLEALGVLAAEGITPRLTIIGSGPEEQLLREQAQQLGIAGRIVFVGRQCGEELVRLLNEHTIMVIPSTVQEGFGLVALEGLACGCVVIASDSGGLPEAVESCGITFPCGNVRVLADRISELLSNPELISSCRASVASHLEEHRRFYVLQQYLSILEQVAGKGTWRART